MESRPYYIGFVIPACKFVPYKPDNYAIFNRSGKSVGRKKRVNHLEFSTPVMILVEESR